MPASAGAGLSALYQLFLFQLRSAISRSIAEPSSPDISVSYNSASTGQLRLLREKPGILQKGVGSSIVRNLDTWDSLSEAFFQTNEVINSEFAGAACLFDAVCVVYEMDFGVGAFEQEVTTSAAFVLCVQEYASLNQSQLSNVGDLERQTGI